MRVASGLLTNATSMLVSGMPQTRAQLRSRLAAAIRWGNEDEVAAIKVELLDRGLEADLRKRLDGVTLTAEQVERFCALLTEHGPRVSMRSSIDAMPAEVERLVGKLGEMRSTGGQLDLFEIANS